MKIYTDGSYFNGKVGYGAVILDSDDNIVLELTGSIDNETTAEGTRNVAGELYAVGKAIQWCKDNDINEVNLYYDYTGVECWPKGFWKAKKSITKRYKEFMRSSGVSVTFCKVKAHSGNRWNDYADMLSKKAVGLD